jgi:hypothetical protein
MAIGLLESSHRSGAAPRIAWCGHTECAARAANAPLPGLDWNQQAVANLKRDDHSAFPPRFPLRADVAGAPVRSEARRTAPGNSPQGSDHAPRAPVRCHCARHRSTAGRRSTPREWTGTKAAPAQLTSAQSAKERAMAPHDTNTKKEARRHAVPIIVLILIVVGVAIGLFLWVSNVTQGPEETTASPVEEQPAAPDE